MALTNIQDDPYAWGDPTAKTSVPAGPVSPLYADPAAPAGQTNGFTPTTDPNLNPEGSRAGPGYGEQFWQNNQDQWYQPTSSEQYWNGVSGTFAAGPTASTGVSGAYDEYFRPASQTSLAEQGAAQGPRGTTYGVQGMQALAGEAPSRAEQAVDAGGTQFSNYGAQNATGAQAGFKNLTGGAAAGAMNHLSAETGLERNSRTEGNEPVNSQGAFDRFFDPLSQMSDSEKLSQDPSLKAYYDRAQETGQEAIDRATAARGLFGSGAALDESRELTKDLGADRAGKEAAYKLQVAGQSDAERRARMGLAGTLGSSADSANVNASANRRGWQQAADQSMLARDQASRSWAGQGDTMALAKSADTRDWSSLLDNTQLAQSKDKLAWTNAADADRARRDQLRFGYSTTSDANSLASSADDRAWATAGDTSRIANSADQRNWADLLDTGNRADQRLNLDFMTGGANIAGGVDATKLAQLESAARGAATADTSQRTRLQDQFDNMFKLAGAGAGATSASGERSTEDWLKILEAIQNAKLGKATDAFNIEEGARNKRDEAGSTALGFLGL